MLLYVYKQKLNFKKFQFIRVLINKIQIKLPFKTPETNY